MTPAPAETLTLLPELTPVLRFVYTSGSRCSESVLFSTQKHNANRTTGLRQRKSCEKKAKPKKKIKKTNIKASFSLDII